MWGDPDKAIENKTLLKKTSETVVKFQRLVGNVEEEMDKIWSLLFVLGSEQYF